MSVEAGRNRTVAATAHDCANGHVPSGGFTLIEVVVAMAIAGLALVMMFQAGSTGLFAVDSATRVEQAVERAQSRLAALGRAGAIAPGETEGDDGDGYRWRLRVRPVETRPAPLQSAPGASMILFDLEVTVAWRAGGRERLVVLNTRRLGTALASR
jgi:general secretion pathway protein I